MAKKYVFNIFTGKFDLIDDSGHTIKDEGTALTQRTNLNFVGSGVTVTDDAGNNATKVTINTGAAGSVDDAVAYFMMALGT